MPENIIRCERCGRILDPKKAVWLELSNTDGYYYKDLIEGHVSQGAFPFGPVCAKDELEISKIANED